MLDMKHFKFMKEEYVILKKDTLEDVIYTAITLTSMLEQHYRLVALGYEDEEFDISKVTVEDQVFAYAKHSINYRNIADRILENL